METTCFSETLVSTHKCTQSHNPEQHRATSVHSAITQNNVVLQVYTAPQPRTVSSYKGKQCTTRNIVLQVYTAPQPRTTTSCYKYTQRHSPEQHRAQFRDPGTARQAPSAFRFPYPGPLFLYRATKRLHKA
jgi:hypothetical protein